MVGKGLKVGLMFCWGGRGNYLCLATVVPCCFTRAIELSGSDGSGIFYRLEQMEVWGRGPETGDMG